MTNSIETTGQDDESIIGPLPVAVMQALYHEITGKTETLSKGFREPCLIRKNDIEQLCIKIHQICNQFDVIGESINYSVKHIKGVTNKFSSLEKFLQYDENYPHAIDNITVQFSVLIQVPATHKHYQYKTEIVIENTEIKNEKIRTTAESLILSMFEFDNIKCKIEYVDYVVARTFLAAVEEWVAGLERVEANAFLLKLKGLTNPRSPIDYLRMGTNSVTFGFAFLAAYRLNDKIIINGDLRTIGIFGLMAAILFLITRSLTNAFFTFFQFRLIQ